jgi:hypothetical protein
VGDTLKEFVQIKNECQQRIAEHYDYYHQEVFGWTSSTNNVNAYEKALPYYDWHTLAATQRLGAKLFHESMLATVIHQNLLSYIVGTGHTYEVKALPGANVAENQIKKYQAAIDRMMMLHDWPERQEEYFNRRFRTGDIFRAVEPWRGVVDFAFIESHNVRKPDVASSVEKAPFGIEYEANDVNRPKTFYVLDSGRISPVPAKAANKIVLHGKRGVDRNDPRGVPLLWNAYCPTREVDELDRALSKIMAALADHAVVYQYPSGTTNAAIVATAEGATAKARKNAAAGKLGNPGGAHHARDHEVMLNGVQLDGASWVEILHSKMRRVGVIAALPEFIVTGDAETGSRNTLFVAEAPFTRRISREAKAGAEHEIEVLYHAIAVAENRFGNVEWMNGLRENVYIDVEFPIAESQDKAAETNRVLRMLETETVSPQRACQMLGHDYEEIQAEWETHLNRIAQRRESVGPILAMDAESIRVRAEVAQNLINAGYEPSEALEYVGLDPIESLPLVQMPAPRQLPQPEPEPAVA